MGVTVVVDNNVQRAARHSHYYYKSLSWGTNANKQLLCLWLGVALAFFNSFGGVCDPAVTQLSLKSENM